MVRRSRVRPRKHCLLLLLSTPRIPHHNACAWCRAWVCTQRPSPIQPLKKHSRVPPTTLRILATGPPAPAVLGADSRCANMRGWAGGLSIPLSCHVRAPKRAPSERGDSGRAFIGLAPSRPDAARRLPLANPPPPHTAGAPPSSSQLALLFVHARPSRLTRTHRRCPRLGPVSSFTHRTSHPRSLCCVSAASHHTTLPLPLTRLRMCVAVQI